MYGNHPYGTRTKSDVNRGRGCKMRWTPRTRIKGREFPVTVTKIATA